MIPQIMAEFISPQLEKYRKIQQNVRVGDRLAVRYTGVGNTFNVAEEMGKSHRLGSPTFQAIYHRSVNNLGEFIARITPDGQMVGIMANNKGLVFSSVTQPANDLLTIPDSMEDDIDEIVVIANFASQTPEIVATLSESTIEQDFEWLQKQLELT